MTKLMNRKTRKLDNDADKDRNDLNKKNSCISKEGEKKEETLPSLNNKLHVKTGILLIFISCTFFFLGSWRERRLQILKTDKIPKESNKIELLVNWRGIPNSINEPGDLNRDACYILTQCFASKYFALDPVKYPENPLQPCHNTLKLLTRGFDNGYFYEGTRIVGFISGETINEMDFSAVNLYNVCIRPEDRGKGFAKSMVINFVKQVIDKRIKPYSNSKIYIGLDVDFGTETAVSAFSLYAKMGFNRWWEPCPNIAEFNYRLLNRQHDLANPPDPEKRPSFIFPMSQLILRRRETLLQQLRNDQGKVYKHFCMVMLWDVDDFGVIGDEMKKIVESALLEEEKFNKN